MSKDKSKKQTSVKKEKKPVTTKNKTKKDIKPKKIKQKRKKTQDEKKLLKIKEKIKLKKHPTFRGRFGARFKRRKSNKKWDKWKRPRGIDIIFKNEDGALVKIGYRVPKAIRFLHPSGQKEVLVSNLDDLEKVKERQVAVRFAAKIGKRKRIQMLKRAKEQKIFVVNKMKRMMFENSKIEIKEKPKKDTKTKTIKTEEKTPVKSSVTGKESRAPPKDETKASGDLATGTKSSTEFAVGGKK